MYLPGDGWIDPSGSTTELARRARALGVTVETGVPRDGHRAVARRGHRRRSSPTAGRVRAEIVVNAAGMWGRQVAAMAGVSLPITPLVHQHLATKPIPGHELPRDDPVPPRSGEPRLPARGGRRVPHRRLRAGAGGRGRWTACRGTSRSGSCRRTGSSSARSWRARSAACRSSAGRRWRISPTGPRASRRTAGRCSGRCRACRVSGRRRASPTRDSAPGAAIGDILAEWLVEGEPPYDVGEMNVRRFGPVYEDRAFAAERARESYRYYYMLRYPHDENQSVRERRLLAARRARASRWAACSARRTAGSASTTSSPAGLAGAPARTSARGAGAARRSSTGWARSTARCGSAPASST